HHTEGDGLPDVDVHRSVRGRAHRRLDQPVERDDRGSAAEDRPSAPALYRSRPPRLCRDLEAQVSAAFGETANPVQNLNVLDGIFAFAGGAMLTASCLRGGVA